MKKRDGELAIERAKTESFGAENERLATETETFKVSTEEEIGKHKSKRAEQQIRIAKLDKDNKRYKSQVEKLNGKNKTSM